MGVSVTASGAAEEMGNHKPPSSPLPRVLCPTDREKKNNTSKVTNTVVEGSGLVYAHLPAPLHFCLVFRDNLSMLSLKEECFSVQA